jgi:hypothetical protein
VLDSDWGGDPAAAPINMISLSDSTPERMYVGYTPMFWRYIHGSTIKKRPQRAASLTF